MRKKIDTKEWNLICKRVLQVRVRQNIPSILIIWQWKWGRWWKLFCDWHLLSWCRSGWSVLKDFVPKDVNVMMPGSPSPAPTPPCPSSSTWWRRNWVVSSCHRILACSWTESIRNLHWGHLGPPCRVWDQVRSGAPAVVKCAGLPPSSTVTPCVNSYCSTCPCLPSHWWTSQTWNTTWSSIIILF